MSTAAQPIRTVLAVVPARAHSSGAWPDGGDLLFEAGDCGEPAQTVQFGLISEDDQKEVSQQVDGKPLKKYRGHSTMSLFATHRIHRVIPEEGAQLREFNSAVTSDRPCGCGSTLHRSSGACRQATRSPIDRINFRNCHDRFTPHRPVSHSGALVTGDQVKDSDLHGRVGASCRGTFSTADGRMSPSSCRRSMEDHTGIALLIPAGSRRRTSPDPAKKRLQKKTPSSPTNRSVVVLISK